MADMNVVDKNILDIINKNQKMANPSNVEITQLRIKPNQKKTVTNKSVFKKNKKPIQAPGRIITERVKEVVHVNSAQKKRQKKGEKRKKMKQGKKLKNRKSATAKKSAMPKTKTILKKTIITKIMPRKDTSVKHFKQSIKHVKELKKSVQSLSGQMRKKEATVQKQLQEHKQHLLQMGLDVAETKMHYQHIPKLSMETQMLIESMNKLSAVVKQLLVLFNQKISNEDGPLFSKLDDLAEQNEQIAQGILAVADLVKEKQTPKAQIREVNPYMPQRQMPMQLREQMPTPQQMPQIPPDFGKFQFPGVEGSGDPQQQAMDQQMQMQPMQQQMQQQPMQPIPQFGAPLPPFSEAPQPQQEQLPTRKRMLF